MGCIDLYYFGRLFHERCADTLFAAATAAVANLSGHTTGLGWSIKREVRRYGNNSILGAI